MAETELNQMSDRYSLPVDPSYHKEITPPLSATPDSLDEDLPVNKLKNLLATDKDLQEKLAQLKATLGDEPNAEKVNVMHSVVLLLIELSQTYQALGVVQAQQLNILTMMQNLYSKKQSELKPPTSTDEEGKYQMNLDQIKLYAGLMQDLAKKSQADINATKENSTQFSDLVSALLDETRSLIASLFR